MTRDMKAERAAHIARSADNLCLARCYDDAVHPYNATTYDGCPTCRADVVRLVDGPPLPEIRTEDVAELANWVGNQVESCEAEIARADSNKYVPEDEDDAEGVSARLDLPYFRRIAAVLEAVSARKGGGNG